MQSNARKPDPVKLRQGSVSSGGETKQVRKGNPRKVPYRVGYSWNRGGRLKELRIRHLARKFLKIWMQNTFGRILPHEAKSHCDSVVLRRAFEGWRDEWWTSRREWSLAMRAECHHRYYLCSRVLQNWRMFLSLRREKKSKVQIAQAFADRQRLHLVWDRWEVFTDVRRMKNTMLESALDLNRLKTLRSAWSLWQMRLQQHQDFQTLEDQALKHRELTLQSRTWLQWKEMHTAACLLKAKDSEAALHFKLGLKRKTLDCWKSNVSLLQTKKRSQAMAQRAHHLRLMMTCWSKWSSALRGKWREEERLRAAGLLAVQVTQRRALQRWRAYVTLCREEAERSRVASQHHHRHLLRVGFNGLSLNVIWSKTQRLNNNMAAQHYHQTMMAKYWRLWQDRLEEAEDESFQPLREKALTYHSSSLLSGCFHHWREKLAEQRHMQELEHRANVWFAERELPRCFDSWVEFLQQKRLNEQRRRKADVYNRRRQYAGVFYTWWARAEERREQSLAERMAVLHDEQSRLQRVWDHWRQRTEQQIHMEEKRAASDRLYLHRLLYKTMTRWKDNSAEIRDRRNREEQACRQGDVRCMRWAVEKWKTFVQSQRVKKSRLKQMQHHHEASLLKHTLVAWKTHNVQMSQIYCRTEELHRQQEQKFLRRVLSVWRENAALLAESRFMERRAQDHFEHLLRLKVFLSWRSATTRAVSKRHQQREAVSQAQRSINQVRLLQSFRRWRKQTRDARRERRCMEKARQHHESKLLSKALTAWNEHHRQYQKNKVMKRQGNLLLKLKMYQTYFEQWKLKLQHRRREAKQTERALWHWSLSLQAKVLFTWRLWVTEQRRKQEQAAKAAQVYRDQLLREGVTCILTYAAHMNDLTTSLTLHSTEQRSRRIQRVVKRCAMRWKQRALCKPRREQEVGGQPVKKSVTFCLTSPEWKHVPPSESAEKVAEDGPLRDLLVSRLRRRQPRRCKELLESPLELTLLKNTQKESEGSDGATPKPSQLASPSWDGCHSVSSCLRPTTSAHQSTAVSVVSPSEPHTSTEDVLLPPSAFMTSGKEDVLRKTSCSDFEDAPNLPPLQPLSLAYPDFHPRESAKISEETEATDPTSALIGELLSIQQDMRTYQRDRRQLRAWQKLKEVLQSWLETSGKDEQVEEYDVCQELKELDERISSLSAELAKRKPTMLQHAERIQHLQAVLTEHSVFTTLQKIRLTRSQE